MRKRSLAVRHKSPRHGMTREEARKSLPLLANRIRTLIKGSRLSADAVLEDYELSLVDAGLGH